MASTIFRNELTLPNSPALLLPFWAVHLATQRASPGR
jgi:hypothetical protein